LPDLAHHFPSCFIILARDWFVLEVEAQSFNLGISLILYDSALIYVIMFQPWRDPEPYTSGLSDKYTAIFNQREIGIVNIKWKELLAPDLPRCVCMM
jgi:hypothetical protein